MLAKLWLGQSLSVQIQQHQREGRSMKDMAGWTITLGLAFIVGSITIALIGGAPSLPMPLAICGAGLFIGGSILVSKGKK